ncbi:MAG: T9SS type A sorting domain-containing protein [Bacteroidia bacterium]|nr:T9SS type A sorting domain-containing protein [Bacteroidia bacterium]
MGSNLQLNETFKSDAAVGNSLIRTWIYENNTFATYPNPTIQLKHSGLNRILYIGSSRFNNRTVCTDSTWLSVWVRPQITTNLGPDIEWIDTTKFLILDPGEFASYTWKNESKTRTMRVEQKQLVSYKNYFWVSVVDSNGCSTTDTIIIYKNSVHVPIDNKNDHFIIFPSPANDFFQIQVNENGDFQYEIYSADGSIIKSGTGNKEIKISTEHIPSGFYTLRLNGKNTQTVMPLMIQH